MTMTRVLALSAALLLATGCWTYPKDVVEDTQQVTPDQAGEDTELPDVPFVEEVGDDIVPDETETPETTTETTPQTFHPEGWTSSEVHGKAAMFNTMNCTMCHGEQLDGGTTGYGCDGCHNDGWRTNCTFCHGGVDNDTGAPPEGIAGETDAAIGAFPGHGAHVTGDTHAPISCNSCHLVPTEATSAGHMFDETPAQAEVDFSNGLSSAGILANKTCSSLYCHGNGQGDNGSIPVTSKDVTCASCHPGPNSSSVALGAMTGRHNLHVTEGLGCYECHGGVFDNEYAPVDGSLHVNGEANVLMPEGITFTGAGCTGICHGEFHMNPAW